jgi:hypothetical protein
VQNSASRLLAAVALLAAALGCSGEGRVRSDGSTTGGGGASSAERAAQAAWSGVLPRVDELLPEIRRLDRAVREAAATEEVDFARLGRMIEACGAARARLSALAGLGDETQPPRVPGPVRLFEEAAAGFARETAPCAAGAALPCARTCVDAWERLAGAYASLVDAAAADGVRVEPLMEADAS